MTIEYSVVPLPQSTAPDAGLHVSLFVSPRLSPDGKLADFDFVARWPEAIADPATEFVLSDNTGQRYELDVTLPDDPRYWRAVFPRDTPVRAWESRSLEGRTLQSFPAALGPRLAQAVHTMSFSGSPIDPPAPSENSIVTLMRDLARSMGAFRETRDGMRYDESRATERLDRATAGGLSPIPTGPSIFGTGEVAASPMAAVVGEVHRARRFFERPESQQEYQPQPDTISTRLPVPEHDFHERLTLLGDQPELLRRLGLIIDLAVGVDDLLRLEAAEWITASIVIAGAGDLTLPTRVLCRSVGDNLVTVGLDGGDWREGRLRLGDPGRFATLDLDPDASALKLDRFLWTTPRLLAQEQNGDPGHAAPPTLKGHGFGVVRTGRADQLEQEQAVAATQTEPTLAAGLGPLLHTEDVVRGLRVEVWDDTEGRWFSLHARVRNVRVDGLPAFDVHDEGWVQAGTVQETQGVQDGKVYVHEQIFGWSGWSLSAPHPGLASEHTYEGSTDSDDPERNERLTDPAAPAHPQLHVVTRSRTESGTLPRLRYGRSYSMRAWAVDLTGASPDHMLIEIPLGPPELPLIDFARTLLAAPREAAPETAVEELVRELRRTARSRPAGPPSAPNAETQRQILEQVLVPGDEDLRTRLMARADPHSRLSGAAGRGRRAAVERAVAPLSTKDGPFVAEPTGWHAESLAAAGGVEADADDVDLLFDTSTPLRPLLRWHPIDPPVLVPRAPYTEGESLRHLVIRSGVLTERHGDQGDEVTLTDVATWLAAAGGNEVPDGYPDSCARHVAPPKISQLEAELQGRFDAAIGSEATAAARRRALLTARREAGTFLDTSIPSLDAPAGEIPLPWVQLVDSPEQVIHDTDQAVLPYLPDPMARGVSLVFPDAGLDRPLRPPIATEGTTADYSGREDWPEVHPYRLVLQPGRPLAASVGDRSIAVSLSPADTLRLRLSSCIERDDLDKLGFWRSLPDEVRANAMVREVAADGWLWPLSPAEDLLFVHAVPKPLLAPRMLTLNCDRADADTGAYLSGAVEVHGPSTDRMEVEGRWTEQRDDVVQAGPEEAELRAVACTLPILEFEDLAVLGLVDQTVDFPGVGKFQVHRARHEFGDTRHRVVAYQARATTRFREYFHPALMADPDQRSVLGPVRRLSIPSSARPAKPAVRQVLPMFRWEEETEPEQPFGVRRRRRAGVRIYLDRPWYSSGNDELLGLVLGELGDEDDRSDAVSQWGADPVWHGRGPARRAITLELDQLSTALGRELPARPVRPADRLPLVDLAGVPTASVLGYRPEFDPERKLWRVDVALNPGSAIWPFVRLVVARYQPDSLADKHLSPLVRCDYVQVPLERTATLTRPDDRTARVVVSGPAGYRSDEAELDAVDAGSVAGLEAIRARIGEHRRVQARLQRQSETVRTDLGWETVAEVPLQIEGFDVPSLTAAWVGQLTLPRSLAARRPGANPRWRVTVEEIEALEADPLPGPVSIVALTPRLPRVVYLDHLAL